MNPTNRTDDHRQANTKRRRRFSAKNTLTAAFAGVFAAVLFAGTGAVSRSPEAGLVAIHFSPWVRFDDAADRVYAAGGVAVGDEGAAGMIWAIGPIGPSAFHERLYDAGAWLVVDEADVYWADHPI